MRVAVILSGCGYQDGAEIRESVLSLLYLDQQGAEVQCFAPDIEQTKVSNHLSGEATDQKRNVMEEAARIARGQIQDLIELDANTFDALVIPGGFGVAINLSDLASKGGQASVNADFAKAVRRFYEMGKPIAAICITPAVIACILRDSGVKLTIGDDKDTAALIEACGCIHVECPSSETVIDEEHRIASCSAYMRGHDSLADIAAGIEKTISAVITMAQNTNSNSALRRNHA